jgi:hypothetical protein
MRSRAPLLFIIATAGCMNEYHPEYHPVTTTTFVQQVSAPTTIINESAAEASDLKIDLPPKVDPPALPPAPGTVLGPNVQIGSGVTFNGNVYVRGDLIIGGTREHPLLMTR